MYNNSFIQKCLRGEVLYTDIDDFVQQWHENETGMKLHEFLGMTEREYYAWVEDDSVLKLIISFRKSGQIFNLDDSSDDFAIAARGNDSHELERTIKWLKEHKML